MQINERAFAHKNKIEELKCVFLHIVPDSRFEFQMVRDRGQIFHNKIFF